MTIDSVDSVDSQNESIFSYKMPAIGIPVLLKYIENNHFKNLENYQSERISSLEIK